MQRDTFSLHQVSFERHQRVLLDRVDIELNEGEWLEVQGANGSGKTTLLRVMAGLIMPQEGAVCWRGECVFKERESWQSVLYYLGHQNGVKPYLTVLENLRLSAVLAGKNEDMLGVGDILKKVGLGLFRDELAVKLSMGQKRRLGLAGLVMSAAKVWILDEPTTSLDVDAQVLFSELLEKHLLDGGMAVVATHQELRLSREPRRVVLGREFY